MQGEMIGHEILAEVTLPLGQYGQCYHHVAMERISERVVWWWNKL